MTDARTQAIAQRRNLLNIENEYFAAIERLQRAATMTRKEIERIEAEHGLNDSQYHRVVMQNKVVLDTYTEKL